MTGFVVLPRPKKNIILEILGQIIEKVTSIAPIYLPY
jgi:hypothetical protein